MLSGDEFYGDDVTSGISEEDRMLDREQGPAEVVSRAEGPMVPLISAGEVAVLLGLSVAATKRIPPAELPYSRVGARNDRRYAPADVQAYVTARREA